MKTLPLLAAIAALAAVPALAAPPTPARPKLIVAIAVDQFSSQLFTEYRAHFTGGLKRLSDGIVFANGYQAHAATETCPGHSTLLTGAHPARTGIIANTWYDFRVPRADKRVYCAEDERVPGSNSRAYTVSPYHLRVPTLGDRMKRIDPATRVVAVAGKDRAAVMMGGHAPDQRWYWAADHFAENAGGASAPVGAAINANIAATLAKPREAMELPELCAPKAQAIPIGKGQTVGSGRFERAAGDAVHFTSSPELDAATLVMAAALTREMRLGRSGRTDLLAVSLSATDYVGHRYGTEGAEMCLQLLHLDQDLGRFFTFVDGLGVDYAVVLSADHGGLDLPERQRLQGVPQASREAADLTPEAVGRQVAAALGLTGSAFVGDWYIDPAVVPSARRGEAIAAARRILATRAQVDSVFTRAEVAAQAMPAGRPEAWSLLDRLRASYDPDRSPDLFVNLKANVTPIPDPTNGYVATHGSVWDYDRKVPILFWWKGAPREDRPESAMTVEIMPTLAAMIGVPIGRGEVDGRCLRIASIACPR